MASVTDTYIELNTFLKLKDVAMTGGQVKTIIRSGAVTVNGEIETRNKKKLADGDVVVYDGKTFTVLLEEFKQ